MTIDQTAKRQGTLQGTPAESSPDANAMKDLLRPNRVSAPVQANSKLHQLRLRQSAGIVIRIGAGMLGGYSFTWGFMALTISLLFAADVDLDDAETLSYILGFIIFLVIFLWAFAARSVARVWLLLAGGGALMTGTAWLVQRALL